MEKSPELNELSEIDPVLNFIANNIQPYHKEHLVLTRYYLDSEGF
jgi:hypothetical protein